MIFYLRQNIRRRGRRIRKGQEWKRGEVSHFAEDSWLMLLATKQREQVLCCILLTLTFPTHKWLKRMLMLMGQHKKSASFGGKPLFPSNRLTGK